MQEVWRFIKGLRGERPPANTHYVVFTVDDQVFTSQDVPLEVAERLAKYVNGIVLPTDINDLLKGDNDV